MRRLFEAAARVLRDRREMTVAVATAIVAVILIGGDQGDLAAIVALGAAGLIAGRAEKNRLAARDARRQVDELREELIENGAYAAVEAARHRVEVAAWRRRLEGLVKEAREHLASLKRSGCQYCWYAPHLEQEIERAEKRLARTGPLTEQVQISDLLSKEELEKFYANTEEVNTDAAEE